MKKNQFLTALALGLATVFYSCNPTASGDEKSGKTNPTDTMEVAEITRHMTDSTASSYSLNVALPVAKSKNDAAAKAIIEWISEQLGGTYDKAINEKFDPGMLDYYFAMLIDRNQKDFAAMLKDNANAKDLEISYLDSINIEKYDEGNAWVTFSDKRESYSGGAHGSFLFFGQTFRKSDGRRIGWEIFNKTYEEAFQKLLKKGLMEYWQLKNESELENYLMGSANVYYIPLPQCPPLFTRKGVDFVYNQYEIAAYAAGLPSFTIGYNQLEPFMMTTGRRMVKE